MVIALIIILSIIILQKKFFYSGDHSKITLNTKNVFIETTANDLNKVFGISIFGSHMHYFFLALLQ